MGIPTCWRSSKVQTRPTLEYNERQRRTAMAQRLRCVHLGSRAAGGVALVMVEATAVTRDLLVNLCKRQKNSPLPGRGNGKGG
jgi:hypothetical protein